MTNDRTGLAVAIPDVLADRGESALRAGHIRCPTAADMRKCVPG